MEEREHKRHTRSLQQRSSVARVHIRPCVNQHLDKAHVALLCRLLKGELVLGVRVHARLQHRSRGVALALLAVYCSANQVTPPSVRKV